MVLVFLVILAFLAYAILGELERAQEVPAPAAGRCPGCSGTVEADWLICPRCRTQVMEPCGGCGQGTSRVHRFCPHCGTAKGAKP
ncbi:hypothetical protein DESUT3_25740 [Desulfuromonas versatilis]|uniref:DZANK-type domain-containing protein n=1 Tax=Desulfuromonas versatilis TaxID=2802975 RepID=A0ABN6DZK7_9BACT|nr:zinc ribbon domain-containing protein [Desulfuromonas versatilis]BCR05505.1 hypothetical protein DESUT3_25740 [Desulfuromonas versatilis]